MASESAVLGDPAVYAAETGRGYTDEQERRYGHVKNVKKLRWATLEPILQEILHHPRVHWQSMRQRLLEETCDVAAFVADCIESFPAPLHEYQRARVG